MTESLPLPTEIVNWFRRVTLPGSVFAVRITDCHDLQRQELFELSGYFDSPDIAARLVGKARKLRPSQCFMTVNPVGPERLKGMRYELEKNASWTLTDNDILEYRNLVIAVDRGKPEDIENCKVFVRKQNPLTGTIKLRLEELGWPLSMRLWTPASKLLIYPIRLPNDPTSRELLQSVLMALAAAFNTEAALVSTSTTAPSLMIPIVGTLMPPPNGWEERVDDIHTAISVICQPKSPPESVVTIQQLQEAAGMPAKRLRGRKRMRDMRRKRDGRPASGRDHAGVAGDAGPMLGDPA